jgi:hypothetical protein
MSGAAQETRGTLQATTPRADDDAAGALVEMLAHFGRALGLTLRVSAPARVVFYDPTLQRADLVVENLPVRELPDGTEVPQPPIALPRVPVSWPASSLGYILPPLVTGDTGLVLFSDRSIHEWLKIGSPVDPLNGRAHALGDGMFIPGLHPDNAPVPSAMHIAGTHTVVHGPLVALREGAVQPLVLGTPLVAAFTTWTAGVAAAFSTWQGIVPPTAISNGAFITALGTLTATLAGTIATWLSTTVFTT